MKSVIFICLLVSVFAGEVLWLDSDELVAIPKPPNTPDKACTKAKSQNNKYQPWACNQYINWCYFNDIHKGGLAQDYKTWPHVSNYKKTGTVLSGISDGGYNHVAIACDSGKTLCHEPNYGGKPIVCKGISLVKYLFRSYTTHYPPGY